MIALGAALARRGHAVLCETWGRWEEHVRAAGMEFAAAPEYPVFPRSGEALKPYAATARSVAETEPVLAAFGPDVVVHDVLTLAPALAAERLGVPWATLIPHPHPRPAPGAPPYALGARPPRTAAGRALWRALDTPVGTGYRRGRRELDDLRARLGLGPTNREWGGISSALVLVGTLPQLEYPRRWAAEEHVVGPLEWEPPWEDDPRPPPGDGPVVLVAPSTAQDPSHSLVRAALAGLADEDVRVLATLNGRPPGPLAVPPNARVVDWISYARSMPRADVVVGHGGHGTLARALGSGCVAVVVPAGGDQAENAARVDWAGVGTRLPWRLLGPGTLRLAVRRALDDGGARRARARALAAWRAEHDGAERAAELVEELAGDGRRAPARAAAAQAR